MTVDQKLRVLCLVTLLFTCNIPDNETYYDAIGRCLTKNRQEGQKIIFTSSLSCLEGVGLPRFYARTCNGQKITNKVFSKSEFTLLNFWFIECPPCIEEIDELNIIDKQTNCSVISFCRNARDEVLNFKNHTKIDYEIVASSSHIIDEVFHLSYGYPTNILVDKRGNIVSVNLSLDEKSKSYAKILDLIGVKVK